MPTLSTHKDIRIWSIKKNWLLEQPKNDRIKSRVCTINLFIEGDRGSGYHLVMCIADHHTVDTWHESQKDAMEDAHEMFGVRECDWREIPDDDNS